MSPPPARYDPDTLRGHSTGTRRPPHPGRGPSEMDPSWIVSRQGLDHASNVVAHHADVRVGRRISEAVVVQVRDYLLDTGFIGEGLRELRRKLRFAEDSLHVGGFDAIHQLRELTCRRILARRRSDDADELESIASGEVRVRLVEGDELAVVWWNRGDLLLDPGVQVVQL